MKDVLEVVKTKDDDLHCNTCRSHVDIHDIRFKTGSGTTVFRMCGHCRHKLIIELEKVSYF